MDRWMYPVAVHTLTHTVPEGFGFRSFLFFYDRLQHRMQSRMSRTQPRQECAEIKRTIGTNNLVFVLRTLMTEMPTFQVKLSVF